jgi:PilZ domain-containing protein
MNLENLLKRWQTKSRKGVLKKGAEKRQHIRLVFSPGKRPRLRVKDHWMEVLNISEKGMKILSQGKVKLGLNVFGTVVFSSKKSFEVTGKIVWQHKKEIGMFVSVIPESIILDEVRGILREMPKEAGENTIET